MEMSHIHEEIVLVDEIGKKIKKVTNFNGSFIKKEYLQHDNISVFKTLQENPHPNICPILEIEENEDSFIVTEPYLGVYNLSHWIVMKENEDFYFVMLQIFDAIEFLHQHQIVHRDLKPENIHVVDGQIIINDFDISKEIIYDSNKNKDTQILGSVGYASPEQYGFMRSDKRTDIYSIGILMNMLLSGKFVNEEISNSRYQPIIKKCTEINPEDRYQSIDELRTQFIQYYKMKTKYMIPGFRTQTKWKMILAPFIYVVMIGVIIVVEAKDGITSMDHLKSKILFAILLIPLFLVTTNYLNIRQLSPRILRKSKLLSSLFVWLQLFVILIILFLLFQAIF